LASALGVPGFVVNKLSSATKKWPLERLQDSLTQLYELDKAIKTGRIEPEFGLERWVVTSITSGDI
jgi:DNA polymerase III delta subunit